MTAKGKTLWEMLRAKMAGPAESRVYNPLGAKIGSPVTVDDPDYEDANFFLVEIRQYKQIIGNQEFLFTDYVVLAHLKNVCSSKWTRPAVGSRFGTAVKSTPTA